MSIRSAANSIQGPGGSNGSVSGLGADFWPTNWHR